MLSLFFRNHRNQNYHRLPSLKVRTPEAAAKFVAEVGFCLLFPDKRFDLPNLMEAVHGGPHPGLVEWSDEVEHVWHWHQVLAAQRKVAEAHYFLNRPTLISPALLPWFMAVEADRERVVDFRTEGDVRLIQDALKDMGPTPSLTLRRSVGMEGKAGHGRFDRALAFLQRSLIVLKVGGVVETGTWTSAVFDLASRAFPEALRRSAKITPAHAREKVLSTYLKAVVAEDMEKARKLFGWPKQDFDHAVNSHIAKRKARIGPIPKLSPQALIAAP
jgi:hypothetical protein